MRESRIETINGSTKTFPNAVTAQFAANGSGERSFFQEEMSRGVRQGIDFYGKFLFFTHKKSAFYPLGQLRFF